MRGLPALRELVRGGARDSGWSGLGQLSALVAGMANLLLLARLVGPEEYGLIAASWALVLTSGSVALLGADRLLQRDASPGACAEPQDVRRAVGAALSTTLLGSTVALVLLLLLQPVLVPQVPGALLLALGIADIAALGVSTCIASLFFAVGDARAAGIATAAVGLGKLLAVLVFAAGGSRDVLVWATGYALLSVLMALVLVGWMLTRFGRPVLRAGGLRRRLREGLPYSGNSAALVLLSDVDKALLVRSGFSADAGHYSVAYRLATIASLPVLSVLSVTFPRFFSRGREGGLPATAAYACRLAPPLIGYAVLAGLALAVAAPLVPVLVGEAFRPSVDLLVLLAPLPLLKVLQSLASDALTGAGLQAVRTRCVVISAAVNLGLNLLLIPLYGVAAAVATTLVAETLYVVLVVLAVRRGVGAHSARQREG